MQNDPRFDYALMRDYIKRHFTAGTRITRPTWADAAIWRRATLAEATARRRAVAEAAGSLSITIALSPYEAAELRRLSLIQKGRVDGFPKRSLIAGSKFLANASQGRKKPVTNKG